MNKNRFHGKVKPESLEDRISDLWDTVHNDVITELISVAQTSKTNRWLISGILTVLFTITAGLIIAALV